MKLPVGFNPHLLPQSEQQTTRAALLTENAGVKTPQEYNAHAELEAEAKRLDTIIQQTLGSFSFDPPSPKRRKLNVEGPADDVSSTVAPFRLVSSALPPQLISLVPVHHKAIPHRRPAEDTTREKRLRREQAKQVAVDADWVLMQSHLHGNRNQGRPAEALSKTERDVDTSRLPNFLVTERARFPILQSENLEEIATTGVKCCPVVHVKELPLHTTVPKARKRKRKRTSSRRDGLSPQFFRPMSDWGGKSAGYAMGWNGSHPVTGASSRRYVRDTMNKGITLSRLERMG